MSVLYINKNLNAENHLTKGVFLPQSLDPQSDLPTFLQSKLEFCRVFADWMNPETVNDVLAYNPQQVLFSHFTLPTERVYKSTYLWSKLALAGYIYEPLETVWRWLIQLKDALHF